MGIIIALIFLLGSVFVGVIFDMVILLVILFIVVIFIMIVFLVIFFVVVVLVMVVFVVVVFVTVSIKMARMARMVRWQGLLSELFNEKTNVHMDVDFVDQKVRVMNF